MWLNPFEQLPGQCFHESTLGDSSIALRPHNLLLTVAAIQSLFQWPTLQRAEPERRDKHAIGGLSQESSHRVQQSEGFNSKFGPRSLLIIIEGSDC
jgi:hypothetical protein